MEIPLSAAFIFAFLYSKSGISSVVFTFLQSHKYGRLQEKKRSYKTFLRVFKIHF
ncbi:hypothetical protein LEP1GSC074_4265 [Leptospira noguchii str. Hook]|uniref:Uncharacterized protein n=1 Tax=Leptospira noguchii serovar Autumnalis str. ZUN142 TaxID=1085540 RepID=M6UJW3_9LEPT|nr:hypothetical protein LEP1GSC041_1902 [Leptospira noguchii str. 2006001870]EMO43086.1 hypothetical protein LEP1GSC186_2447 [Leptospira noguchii serovar Autumnalis str. ZUN142]EMS86007.1 hypothetical protein LEP1GSC074_4265 [Leptospira noguchii str. Hook]EMS88576.1 hypothetical protein LEP1GSC073_3847 [Leptospira noguchii str. Cascata]